jgi:hypothetical protein
MHWTALSVQAELERRGIVFRREDILHGRQLVLEAGEIINVFPNGVVEVGGTVSQLSGVLRELFSGAMITTAG